MMGSKVLLADDSVTIQKVVGIIFANEDYDITIVSTGDAAISKALEIKPDVMLVDALMPGKNGYEVCREIRQNPALSHIAILLMTGAFEVVDEDKNRLSGADEFIIKPFESQTLIEATNRLIALTAQRATTTSSPSAPQPVAPPVVAAPSVDDVWATGFDIEPAPEASQEPVFNAPPVPPAATEVAPVKATSDDDLWGAFDMDSFDTAPAPAPVSIPTPVAATATDDLFGFDIEPPKTAELPVTDEFVLEDDVFAAQQQDEVPTATGFEPVGEQEMSFDDVQSVEMHSADRIPVSTEDDFSGISFDEPFTPAAAAVPEPMQPVVEVAPPVAPPPLTPPSIPEPKMPVSAVAPAALDENQLRELLSTVSREMIERIVWEIVPDLAETIIKEEIRKLKAGIA